MRTTIIVTLFALVLTLLATTTKAVKVPELFECTRAYSGINQTCDEFECLGDSYCAPTDGVCFPKQVFIGDKCTHHYECYKGFGVNENPAIYCDKTENKCKWTKEVGKSCSAGIECQSRKCNSGSCAYAEAGDSCVTQSDCKPFKGDLFGCVNSKCTALPTIGEQCLGGKCDSSSWCVNITCVSLDYKKEGDSCTPFGDIPSDICRPVDDGASGAALKCIDNVCTYPPRLRESCTGSYDCVADYAEECGGDYGLCQNKRCYRQGDCTGDEFCDCTYLVCQNRNYGNKIQECYYTDGFRKPSTNAYLQCLAQNCPNSVSLSTSVLLNKSSCPYKKCLKAYREVAKCVINAGETYGAQDIYFFGL